MKLFFATTNAAKLAGVARVLGACGIEVERVHIDLPEFQAENVMDVAKGKVRAAFAALAAPVMVNDSALYIRVLGGFPGTNVKQATRQLGAQGYLDLLARYREPRTCRIENVIAFFDARLDEPRVFLREEHGSVATKARGKILGQNSAIDALFVPQGQKKTLAEMTNEEIAAYRSRPVMEQYLRAFADWLRQRNT